MNKYILLAITALCLQDMQAQTVVHPSIKTKTTFAIVVDQKSYDEAKSEIDAYRTSIEKEGLGTYLLIDDWKRPDLFVSNLSNCMRMRKRLWRVAYL